MRCFGPFVHAEGLYWLPYGFPKFVFSDTDVGLLVQHLDDKLAMAKHCNKGRGRRFASVALDVDGGGEADVDNGSRWKLTSAQTAWIQGENKAETTVGTAPYSLYRFVFRKISA